MSYLIQFDGACRGNPGKASYGFVIYQLQDPTNYHNKTKLYQAGDYLGIKTNNQSEYEGLLNALTYFNSKYKDYDKLYIEGDSLLVINQMMGVWKVREPILKEYYNKVLDLINKDQVLINNTSSINLRHIRREYNTEADKICNEILDSLEEKVIFQYSV